MPDMPKSSAPLNSMSNQVATMLLMSVWMTFAVAVVGLIVGISLNPIVFPLAIAMAGTLTVCFSPRGATRRWLPLSLGLIVAAVVAGTLIPDYSSDGVFYHQQTIVALMEGWNPYRDFNPDNGYLIWVNCYSKGLEIAAAGVASATGMLESGKGVNILLAVGTGFAVWGFLASRLPQWSRRRLLMVVLAVVCNPVVIAQLFTYYIDFAKYIFLLLTLILLMQRQESPSRFYDAMLGAVIVAAIATKFNIFFEEGVWILLAIVWIWAKQGAKAALSLTMVGGVAAIVGLLLTYHPYLTNYLDYGHPLYPLLGENAEDIMTGNTPDIFLHGNRFINFFRSLFSLSLPTVDCRIGGFGFLMAPILISASYLLVRSWRSMPGSMRYALICCLVSCFFFEQSWWARYNCQLWFIPAVAIVVGYNRRDTRIVTRIAVGLMLATALTALLWGMATAYAKDGYRYALLTSLSQEKVMMMRSAPQFERCLMEHDVEYEVVDSIPDEFCGTALYFYERDPNSPIMLLSSTQAAAIETMCGRLHLNYKNHIYEIENHNDNFHP